MLSYQYPRRLRNKSDHLNQARRALLFELLEDRRLLTADLVSVTPPSPSTAGEVASTNPVISANGRYVAFQSEATDLVAGVTDANDLGDVFVRDLLLDTTVLISVVPEGARTADGASLDPSISDDGRFIAFISTATNLVKDVTIDTGAGSANVFVRDRDADEDGVFDETGAGETATRLLSVASDGSSGNGPSGGFTLPFVSSLERRPVISGDGTSVAFASFASDLSLDDTSQTDINGAALDVYRAPTAGGKLTLLSVNAEGSGSCTFVFGTVSTNPSISGTGGAVAFQSNCGDIVSAATGGVDDTNLTTDIFVGSGGRAAMVSVNGDGTNGGDGASREPVISRDGRHVAFVSKASDLVRGMVDANGLADDVFVRDLKNERTTLVSRSRAVTTPITSGDAASPTSPGGGEFFGGPAISETGRFVAFVSAASDLLDPTEGVADTNGMPDLFVFDRDSDLDGVFDEPAATRTILVSANSAGTDSAFSSGGSCGSFAPSLSRDGRFVAFASTCGDLIEGVGGGNVYVRDLLTGTTALVSSTISGEAGGALASGSRNTSISGDGSRIAFISDTLATDLDPTATADPNGESADVFVGTPPTDIRLTRNFATGFDTHTQYFRIFNEPALPAFEMGYYRSPTRLFDPSDPATELLGTIMVTDPDDLIVDGNRTLIATIGTALGDLTFPGIGADDLDEDYFVLTVGDHVDALTEFDGDPFNEDNTSALRGLYYVKGDPDPTPVFVHGRAGGDMIGATSDGTTLTITYGSTALGVGEAYTYAVADVSEVRVRAHEGDDVITGSDLVDVFFGGEGNDRLDGGAGDDILDGGPGKDTIIGGPGADMIFDGCGDDLVDVGPDDDVIMSTPCSDDIFIDGGGSDTLDFSLDDQPITFDLDSTAVQTVDGDGNTVQLVGQWENFVGSPFGNGLTLRPLPVPRRVTGGPGNDRLLLDADGNPVRDDGTKFSFPNSGLGDISYSGFEEVRVINAAARIIDDGDSGYSASGFTRQFNPQFPQGFNGDIEFSDANAGNTATWTFNDLAPGQYTVSATWTSAPDRASSAPFRIYDGTNETTPINEIIVNQELPPGEFEDRGVTWSNLDIVHVTGNTLTVELTDVGADATANDPNEFVIADAIRIEPIVSRAAHLPLLIDDAPNHPSAGGLTPTIHEGTGPNAFSIIGSVIAFQTDLGGPDNGDTPGSQGSGARQINWDNVPDANATPNLLPGDFFNSTFTRGLQLHTAGDGFQVSGSALSQQGLRFDNLNDTYDMAFGTLSPERLFTPVGDNVVDVTFFVPGSNAPATVSGFGAVFTDVDTPLSHIEYFDVAGEQLLSRSVLSTPGDGSLSFLGVKFVGGPIARVRITAGDGALLATGSPDDITQGGANDLVVLDDFIYGEPIPLPAPVPNAGFSSDCSAIRGAGFLSDQHTCSNGQEASWDLSSLPVLPPGQYIVSATWTSDQNLSDAVRYLIANGSTETEATANQQLPPDDFTDGGVPWERLATVTIVNGQPPIVTASDPQGGMFVVDAIRLDPAPDIQVRSANSIDDIPLFGNFDFGRTALSSTGLATLSSGQLVVSNIGSSGEDGVSLDLGPPQVTGDGFSLSQPLGTTSIPPGGSTAFEIQFDQTNLGQFNGTVTIPTNDFDKKPFVFNLTANVVDDTMPPTVDIVSPDDGAVFIEGTSMPVSFDVNDDIQVHAVDVLVNGTIVRTLSGAPFDTVVTLPTGVTLTQIGATAHDASGNSTDAAPITVNLIEDQPPTVQIVRPFDGDGVIEGSTIAVQIDAEDDVGIERVELRLNGNLQETLFFEPFVTRVQLPNITGNLFIEACADDTFDNTTCQTVTVTAVPPPLTTVESIFTAADAGQPPIVRVFDPDGTVRFQFFAYDPSFLGGVRVATGDINGDGTPDIITGAAAGGSHVKVFDGTSGELLRSFFSFPGFLGGVTVATGDISGDGHDDIIVGAGAGSSGGHVKVFDGVSNTELRSFLAFPGFTGGVFVAAGDVNGDAREDIISGAGAGGGPHVKVFDGQTHRELQSFFAYDPTFLGGVRVAAGDVNGDGFSDIITGAGPGGGPHVKVFDGTTGAEHHSFFAFEPDFDDGVFVTGGNLNDDEFTDIIVGAHFLDEFEIASFDGSSRAPLPSIIFTDGFESGDVSVWSMPTDRKPSVVNLPPDGGTIEVKIDGSDLVVQQLGGNEHFRSSQDGVPRLRINGAADLDDLLIVNLDGITVPIIFDGGEGGNDVLRLEGGDEIPQLEYEFFNATDGRIFGDSRELPRGFFYGLEPIIDNLNVVDRVFSFSITDDQISFNTDDSPSDSILRIDSNNSELVDFVQPSGSLTIESEENDTTDIGTGWTFDDTEVVDGEFVRLLSKDGLVLRMIGPRDWSNPANPLDVNANGSVEPADVLVIFNELNNPKFRDSVGLLTDASLLQTFPDLFFDPNGDGFVVPLDSLIIINFLNRISAQSEGEGSVALPLASYERGLIEPSADASRSYERTDEAIVARDDVYMASARTSGSLIAADTTSMSRRLTHAEYILGLDELMEDLAGDILREARVP